MKLTWLGHSAFKLEESTGTTVVTDPYDRHAVGYEMPSVDADIVTLSHATPSVKDVTGSPAVLNRAGVYEIGGVHIIAEGTDKDANGKNKNIVYKFRMDGVELCHMGDINDDCTSYLMESLIPVNILMIPVGGTSTIDAKAAKQFVDRIMPDIVVPMHYKTRDCQLDIDKVDEFIDLFDDDDVVYLDSSQKEFDRDDFDGESTKVYVFDRYSER